MERGRGIADRLPAAERHRRQGQAAENGVGQPVRPADHARDAQNFLSDLKAHSLTRALRCPAPDESRQSLPPRLRRIDVGEIGPIIMQ
jgi:hypothetical protein